MATNSGKYFKNIFSNANAGYKTKISWSLHLLVLNLEVEVAGEPVIEWWGIHITGGSELEREPVFLLLLLYPHW